MGTIKTLTLIGGISSNSLNQKYFRAIKNLNLPRFQFESEDISRLPFFNRDVEADPPQVVKDFKERVRRADALLFITPEYNRSYPGVLKNAIDWGSRPLQDNVWARKPAAILGATPGSIGTFGAQNHLRQLLGYLNMYILEEPEIYFGGAHKAIDDRDQFSVQKTKELITHFFDEYYQHVQFVQEGKGQEEPPGPPLH